MAMVSAREAAHETEEFAAQPFSPVLPPPPIKRWLTTLVVLAFLLRLVAMTLGHTYRFPAQEDHFSFGWETGRLARSTAMGEGFSSPFHGHTGSSAWIAPLYPYLLAGIFRMFGVYSNTSAWVALAFNSLCSALTCVPLFFIGRQLFGRAVAKWTAIIWAVLPYAIYWAIRFAWETSLATLLLALVFWIAIKLERTNRLRLWCSFGLLWATIALSNPAVLAFLPFCGLWIVYRQSRAGTLRLSYAVISGMIFFALIAPWMTRNYRTFGKLVFIRGNFGAELRLGNGPNADGQWMFWLHPSEDPIEFQRYVSMGEVAYVKARQHEAMQWISQNPGRFAAISGKRFFFWWFGTPRASSIAESVARNMFYSLSTTLALLGLALALRQRRRAAALFLWLFVSFPIVYYFTFTHPRYRHPMEPEMLLLMVFLFTQVEKRGAKSQFGSAAA